MTQYTAAWEAYLRELRREASRKAARDARYARRKQRVADRNK